MAVTAGDIEFHISGGGANTDVDASLGGAISTTEIVDATLNNLFTEVTEDETAAGVTQYRCFYVKNASATNTYKNVSAFINTQSTSPDTSIEIGLGTSAVNGVEPTVANETTAPAGVTFTAAAVDKASGLAIGDIPVGQHKAVWVKLIVNPGAAAANDSSIIEVAGGTAA